MISSKPIEGNHSKILLFLIINNILLISVLMLKTENKPEYYLRVKIGYLEIGD